MSGNTLSIPYEHYVQSMAENGKADLESKNVRL